MILIAALVALQMSSKNLRITLLARIESWFAPSLRLGFFGGFHDHPSVLVCVRILRQLKDRIVDICLTDSIRASEDDYIGKSFDSHMLERTYVFYFEAVQSHGHPRTVLVLNRPR